MPIANSAFSNWMQSMLCVPVAVGDGTIWISDSTYAYNPTSVITADFRIERRVDMSNDTSVRKGQPWAHVWNVGDAIWQIDFTSPFLIYLPDADGDISSTPKSGLQIVDEFIKQWVRVLPTKDNTGAYMGPLFDQTTRNNFQDLWEQVDALIKSVKITIDEDQATLTVSIWCTMDPRPYFYQTGSANLEIWGARVCKPYDLKIPVMGMYAGATKNCIGGPMVIDEGVAGTPPSRPDVTGVSYPRRTANYDSTTEIGTGSGISGHVSLVRKFELELEADMETFQSIGMPSSRPLLGVKNLTCHGSIEYTPLVNRTVLDENTGEDLGEYITVMEYLPEGWIPDMQSLEYVRGGGQLYVAGHPPYTDGGGYDPLWVGLVLDGVSTGVGGETQSTPIPLFDGDLLGPVMVASYSSSTLGGAPLGIKVDFQTNVGVTSFSPSA